jgi:general stress protein 26
MASALTRNAPLAIGAPEGEERARARLFSILRRFRVGTLVTQAEHFVHTQPLSVAAVDEGEEEVVFVTVGDSDAAQDVVRHPEATVVFQDARHCASFCGDAEVVQDPWRIGHLWNEHMRLWFPQGPEDPRLVLLSVRGRVAEYWDVSRARLKLTMIRHLARVLEGEPAANEAPPAPPEQHGLVHIAPDIGAADADGKGQPR